MHAVRVLLLFHAPKDIYVPQNTVTAYQNFEYLDIKPVKKPYLIRSIPPNAKSMSNQSSRKVAK